MDLPGSSVHGILHERILEWVAISSLGVLSNPGIEPASPVSPTLQKDSLPTEGSSDKDLWLLAIQPKET